MDREAFERVLRQRVAVLLRAERPDRALDAFAADIARYADALVHTVGHEEAIATCRTLMPQLLGEARASLRKRTY